MAARDFAAAVLVEHFFWYVVTSFLLRSPRRLRAVQNDTTNTTATTLRCLTLGVLRALAGLHSNTQIRCQNTRVVAMN